MHASNAADIKVIPREERGRLDIWQGLYKSWVFIITKPYEFFSKVPSYKERRLPLLFGMFASGASLIWHLIISLTVGSDAMIRELSKMGIAVGRQELFSSTFFIILFFPLFYIAVSYLVSGFLHAITRFLQGEGSFDSTFRVVNYGWAVSVFSILPFLGAFISSAWYFALIAIGMKIVHRLNWPKTITVVLGACVLFMFTGILFSSLLR